MKSLLNRAASEPDRTLAVLGVPLSFGLTVWVALTVSDSRFAIAGIFYLLACLAYLGIRRRLSITPAPISKVDAKLPTYLFFKYSFFPSLLLQYNLSISDIMIVLIKRDMEHTVGFTYSAYRLNYDPREALQEQGFSKIYDCASISAFIE